MNHKIWQLEAEIKRRKRLLEFAHNDTHERMLKELENDLEIERRRENI
jgi:predicted nuclease of restriction endonuclease-like RecB superfamily